MCCLVGRRGKKTFVWGPGIFHLGPQKLFSPKWRENRGENVEAYWVTKVPLLFISITYPSHFSTTCDLINLLPLHPYLFNIFTTQQHELQVLFSLSLSLLLLLFFFFLFFFVFVPCPHYIPHSIVLIYGFLLIFLFIFFWLLSSLVYLPFHIDKVFFFFFLKISS